MGNLCYKHIDTLSIIIWVVFVVYLLQADGIGLGFAIFTQVEVLVKLFGQVAMTALSKYCDFSMKLHSSLKNILETERKAMDIFYGWNV